MLSALLLALLAQFLLETPPLNPIRYPWLGFSIYVAVILLTFWAWLKGELTLSPLPETIVRVDEMKARWGMASAALVVLLLAFLLFRDNTFTLLNLSLWLLGLGLLVRAFWEQAPDEMSLREKTRLKFSHLTKIKLANWTAILLIATGLVIFFRVYRLAEVPYVPYSDHAEKLLDVYDVFLGKTSIFFIRNTGREAMQFYLTAAVALLFGTGVTFMSLKISTVLVGLATLPFIYALGKELGGRRTGLLALVLAGVSYWGNVVSRIGLRYSFYPLFAAATLYYLLRGLRRSSRNDIILAGMLLGAGLHGYTAFRIMPFVVLLAFILYWLHSQSRGMRLQSTFWFGLMILISLMVFLPLLRYALENPQSFSFRSLTRLTGIEEPLSSPAWMTFLLNLWHALTMFFWNNGKIWAHSVMNRPALDLVSAALLLPGVTLVLARYGRERDWRDLFLILSVPLLMMPSILSIAFPQENPSFNRAGAALIPVVLIISLCLDGIMSSLERAWAGGKGTGIAWGLAITLLSFSCWQNYDLVFRQYDEQYRFFSLNPSELGEVVRDFLDSGNTMEQVFVLEYPHWVDSRLVAIAAGHPEMDPVIKREHLFDTLGTDPPLLFLFNQEDTASLEILTLLYPQGILNRYTSDTPRRNFWIYSVAAGSRDP
jgi:4-amino-4-deoxy-L-arabinose transferase-like glycosyltransferase